MSHRDDPERTASETDPRDDAGESLEAMMERADHAFAAESFGTTAEEQGRGESLDDRLAEELPDPPTNEVDLAIEDADAPDTEPKMIGEIVRERDPYVSPEDAAMSIRERAPGATDHRDDEYVELYDRTLGDEAP
jgi:hypothetical protein